MRQGQVHAAAPGELSLAPPPCPDATQRHAVMRLELSQGTLHCFLTPLLCLPLLQVNKDLMPICSFFLQVSTTPAPCWPRLTRRALAPCRQRLARVTPCHTPAATRRLQPVRAPRRRAPAPAPPPAPCACSPRLPAGPLQRRRLPLPAHQPPARHARLPRLQDGLLPAGAALRQEARAAGGGGRAGGRRLVQARHSGAQATAAAAAGGGGGGWEEQSVGQAGRWHWHLQGLLT